MLQGVCAKRLSSYKETQSFSGSGCS